MKLRRDGSVVLTTDGAGRITERPMHWRRHLLVVVLTFATGCSDAIGFLALGGAFSSVMTGNMVLLGLSAGHTDASLAQTSATAIVAYVVGVLVGARVAGVSTPDDPVWPPAVTRALIVELAVFAGFLVLWECTVGDRSRGVAMTLLAIAAAAMGIQGSAVQRFGVPGLSSTYLTGTLTTLIGGIAARKPVREVLPGAWILLALIAGAGLGAVFADHLERLAPVLIIAPIAAVVLLTVRARERRS